MRRFRGAPLWFLASPDDSRVRTGVGGFRIVGTAGRGAQQAAAADIAGRHTEVVSTVRQPARPELRSGTDIDRLRGREHGIARNLKGVAVQLPGRKDAGRGIAGVGRRPVDGVSTGVS